MNGERRRLRHDTLPSHAVLEIGNNQVNVSNLYPWGILPSIPDESIAFRKSLMRRENKKKYSKREASLYPNTVNLPIISSANDAFDGISTKKSKHGDNHCQSVPGAFQSDSMPNCKSKVPSKWKDEDISKAGEKRDTLIESSYHRRGFYTVTHEPQHEQEDDPVPRNKIEIAPGKYMDLRGSEETIEAIHMGYSILAGCLFCQSKLQCVADAELVICPDCRVLSPVPQIPTKILSMKSLKKHGSGCVGGVGLGLKLEPAL